MATRAHSTRTPLLPLVGARPSLLPAGSGKQPGPVTLALAAMHAADPDRIRALRQRLAERIEADIALLDALDGDDEREADYTTWERHPSGSGVMEAARTTDEEPSLCGTSVSWPGYALYGGGEDREHDTADDEPSLGSLGSTGTPMDQTHWSAGGSEDCEAGDDNGLADNGGLEEQICRYLDLGGDAHAMRLVSA